MSEQGASQERSPGRERLLSLASHPTARQGVLANGLMSEGTKAPAEVYGSDKTLVYKEEVGPHQIQRFFPTPE